MFKPLDNFRNFLYTQYFSDGIKITIGVLLPSFILFQFGEIGIGITLSLGAVCASIADSPGPWVHRRNAMLITVLLACLVAVTTTLLNYSLFFTGIEIFIFCFIFGMLNVYGTRASAVGTAALLMMILNIDNRHSQLQISEYAFIVFGGGLWYFLLSALFSTLRPYRYAQQTLGDCIQEIAIYLRLRAKFYDDSISVDDVFKKLVDEQVKVHELQDNVREVLFKTRKLINDSTNAGRLLVVIFADMVDLFEQTMATHHDYEIIRKKYKNHDVLSQFSLLIHQLANEIDYLGFCLIHQVDPKKHILKLEDLERLKLKLDELEADGIQVLVLKKIIINLRHIFNRTNVIYGYFDDKTFKNQPTSDTSDRTKFVSHQSFDFKLFKNNLNFKSGNFRYALRLAIVALFGFVIGNFLPIGHHTYWIILTILVILKPGFSTTKQRNYERVIGTIIGGILGGTILYFIHDETARFLILVVFMVITYSTIRIQYFISVLFLTPFILILFSFIGGAAQENIAFERISDTLIGSAIAFISSYLVFPIWESYQFKTYMADMLKANLKYLDVIYAKISNKTISITTYKLARKEVYVNTANLAAAFQRMLNEPKNKQYKASEVHKFVVLNHVLSSYLANLSASIDETDFSLDQEQRKFYNKASFYLKASVSCLSGCDNETLPLKNSALEENISEDLITEQLELIAKVSSDIWKITEKLDY